MRSVHFLLRAAVTVATVACASASPPEPSRPSERVLATTNEGVVIRDYDPLSYSSLRLEVLPDSIFSVLRAVYAELGVEVKLSDPQTGEFGNRVFTKFYQLGGVALHRYVGCGTTLTGPGADSYRVQMSLVSYVARNGTGSTVQTQLMARADDPGSSKGWLTCLSTGVLEERVHQMLTDKLRRPQA